MDNRRGFIKKASLLTGTLGFSSMLPSSIQRALAIDPEMGTSYLDAEHVVFLMQENRSFDHVFGSLKGVRGFNDPRAIRLANNYPVWLQSNKKGETYAPFRLNIRDTKATWMSSLPHSWDNQIDARNNGKYDGWLEAKRSGNKEYADMPLTLGYYNRQDIPFYYALADAFTVCDHNFCSSLTGTSSNRCFFWTAKIREEQQANSKPHLSNGDIDGSERVSWSTFPERLSKHGVDWKIYQNELSVGVGFKGEEDGWLGNFTDNTIEFFKQYHVKRHPEHITYLKRGKEELEKKLQKNADPKLQERLDWVKKELDFLEKNPLEKLSPEQQDLHRRAFVTNRNDPDYHKLETISYMDNGTKRTASVPKGDVLHQFRADVNGGKLPAVSWLVAPCNFSDHPGAPWYGAWYLSEVMDILTKNPEVWKKTIFVLTYDENDGYFDHMPPFVAPNPNNPATGIVSKSLDIDAEFVQANNDTKSSPVGLGYRVPMVVVSPWTRGGYVNSQVFDHTSSIQFLEHFLSHKTGQKIQEDNITSWRRSLCGDLTSVFRPYQGEKLSSPQPLKRDLFVAGIHKAQFAKIPDNFKKLTPQDITEIVNNPSSPLLPKQEPGIKPANAIPYEVYAHGNLDKSKGEFDMVFTAGNDFFGKASSGVGFNVYAGDKNWAFTADAGDTLNYQWPLETFPNKQYDLKVYSANGFYRRYKGDINDPEIAVAMLYDPQKNKLLLRITRITHMQAMKFTLTDQSYGQGNMEIILPINRDEMIKEIDIAKNHNWYDLVLRSVDFPWFSQQYAGHLEYSKESFTDPLLGGISQLYGQ